MRRIIYVPMAAMQIFPLAAILISSLLLTIPAFAGDWESSGGDGVACWKTLSEAAKARRELTEQKHLSLESKKAISSLETLDYWEYKEKTGLISLEKYNIPRSEVLRQVDEFLFESVPLFARRLRLAADKIKLKDWADEPHLVDVKDSVPIRKIGRRCLLIQLVERRSKENPGRLPKVSVSVDRWLFENKLSPMNQAVLEVHERIYIIGRALGYQNSNRIRNLVMKIVTAVFKFEARKSRPIGLAAQISRVIHFDFGEYIRIFAKEAPPVDIADSPYSPYSRFVSFASVLEASKKQVGRCLKQSEKPSYKWCKDQVIAFQFAANDLSEEQSFMFYAWYVLYLRAHQINAERLMDWLFARPLANDSKDKELLAKACFLSNDFMAKSPLLEQKVKSYCRKAFSNSP